MQPQKKTAAVALRLCGVNLERLKVDEPTITSAAWVSVASPGGFWCLGVWKKYEKIDHRKNSSGYDKRSIKKMSMGM